MAEAEAEAELLNAFCVFDDMTEGKTCFLAIRLSVCGGISPPFLQLSRMLLFLSLSLPLSFYEAISRDL